jgi:hypothetical protein
MIEKLTSELNRINQGCGDGFGYRNPETGLLKYSCNKEHLCPKCEGKKETLKKVSIMWADEMLRIFQGLFCSRCNKDCEAGMLFKEIRYREEELKQIKSLMEKE